MTELLDAHSDILRSALLVVDEALARYSVRDVVPAAEVADLLLDVRALLVVPPAEDAQLAAEPAVSSSS